MKGTDWIDLFIKDRRSMVKIMRENAAADLKAGYGIGEIAKQMAAIEEYEKESDVLLRQFCSCIDAQKAAYRYLVKVGVIG